MNRHLKETERTQQEIEHLFRPLQLVWGGIFQDNTLSLLFQNGLQPRNLQSYPPEVKTFQGTPEVSGMRPWAVCFAMMRSNGRSKGLSALEAAGALNSVRKGGYNNWLWDLKHAHHAIEYFKNQRKINVRIPISLVANPKILSKNYEGLIFAIGENFHKRLDDYEGFEDIRIPIVDKNITPHLGYGPWFNEVIVDFWSDNAEGKTGVSPQHFEALLVYDFHFPTVEKIAKESRAQFNQKKTLPVILMNEKGEGAIKQIKL